MCYLMSVFILYMHMMFYIYWHIHYIVKDELFLWFRYRCHIQHLVFLKTNGFLWEERETIHRLLKRRCILSVCVSDIRVHHHFKYAIYFYKNDKYTNICSTILKYHCIVIKGMLKIARVISGKIQFNSIMNLWMNSH